MSQVSGGEFGLVDQGIDVAKQLIEGLAQGAALVRLGCRWDRAVEVCFCAAKSRAVSNRNCVVATRGGEQRNENEQSVTQASWMGRRRELDSVGVAAAIARFGAGRRRAGDALPAIAGSIRHAMMKTGVRRTLILECARLLPLFPPGRLVGPAEPRSAARRLLTRPSVQQRQVACAKAARTRRIPNLVW